MYCQESVVCGSGESLGVTGILVWLFNYEGLELKGINFWHQFAQASCESDLMILDGL
jgi:hypothetical protein